MNAPEVIYVIVPENSEHSVRLLSIGCLVTDFWADASFQKWLHMEPPLVYK